MADARQPAQSGAAKILVIEGDPATRASLAATLESQGYVAVTAADGPSGLQALFSHHPDLVILALILPGMDGWTVLDRIREATDIPAIIVSRKLELASRLRALQLRVDDFIIKPFDPQELSLRVKVALDHSRREEETAPAYDDGALCIDAWKRSVTVDGQLVPLTPRELRLLVELARQPGRVIPYDDLLDALPSLGTDDPHAVLRSIIHRLRRRLEQARPGSHYVLTQRGVGIRLNVK